MAVRISKIETAPAATMIDLHIIKRAWSAAIRNSLDSDSVEDVVKLRLINLKGVVMTLELRVIVEVERERVVDPHGSEVR